MRASLLLVIAVCFGDAKVAFRGENEVWTGTNSKSLWDTILDKAFDELRTYLRKHGETNVPLPDIVEGFEKIVLGVKVDGEFLAKGGRFRNPATVSRIGESHVKPEPGGKGLIFDLDIGFSEMVVSYDYYKVSLIGIPVDGSVSVKVGENTLALEIVVLLHPCRIKVTKVEVTKLTGLDVSVTGLSILDPLVDEIVAVVLSSYKTSFSSLIQNVVQRKLHEELAYTSLCKGYNV